VAGNLRKLFTPLLEREHDLVDFVPGVESTVVGDDVPQTLQLLEPKLDEFVIGRVPRLPDRPAPRLLVGNVELKFGSLWSFNETLYETANAIALVMTLDDLPPGACEADGVVPPRAGAGDAPVAGPSHAI
jgi:hypothetical protein